MTNLNLKKFFLYLLVASIALSALIGIGIFLFGNFVGDFELKVLLTTLTVTVTSLLGSACGAFLETGRGRAMPVCGIIFAVASAVMWFIVIWHSPSHNEVFAKTLMSVTLFAAACSHLSLLSLARLDRRFRWSSYAAQAAVWSLTAILFYLIWFEKSYTGDWIPRTLGVLSIVVAALTILTPILHKLSSQTPKTEEIDAEIEQLRRRIAELETLRGEIRETSRSEN